VPSPASGAEVGRFVDGSRRSLVPMITTEGETLRPSVATTRHGERARVTYLGGRPGARPTRKQIEGVICDSLTESRLTIHAGDRHKSIHLTRVQRVVMPAGPSS
jgi:hypothetical protein